MVTKRFTLYIGLNDAEAKKQIISTEAAYKMIASVFIEKIGGGTITEAEGIYTHEDGTVVHENTIRVEAFGCEKDDIVWICDYLKKALNQESIAVVTQEIESEFM